MKRNIVILNGSPRRGEHRRPGGGLHPGAEAAGHQVTTFFLEELDLHGCRGCFGGPQQPALSLRAEGRHGQDLPRGEGQRRGGVGLPPCTTGGSAAS